MPDNRAGNKYNCNKRKLINYQPRPSTNRGMVGVPSIQVPVTGSCYIMSTRVSTPNHKEEMEDLIQFHKNFSVSTTSWSFMTAKRGVLHCLKKLLK